LSFYHDIRYYHNILIAQEKQMDCGYKKKQTNKKKTGKGV